MDDDWDDPLADPLYSPVAPKKPFGHSRSKSSPAIKRTPLVPVGRPGAQLTAPKKPPERPHMKQRPSLPMGKPPSAPAPSAPIGKKPQVVIRRKTTVSAVKVGSATSKVPPRTAPLVPTIPPRKVGVTKKIAIKKQQVGMSSTAEDATRHRKVKVPRKLQPSATVPNMSVVKLGDASSAFMPRRESYLDIDDKSASETPGGVPSLPAPAPPVVQAKKDEAEDKEISLEGMTLQEKLHGLGLADEFSSAFEGMHAVQISNRFELAEKGFSKAFKEEFFRVMDGFPVPPTKVQKVKRTENAPTTAKGVKTESSSMLNARKIDTGEEEIERKTMELLKKACSGDEIEMNAFITSVHKLSLSDFKVFQDRAHEQIQGEESKKKGKNPRAEGKNLEITSCILQFGMVQKACRLNEVLKDTVKISYRGKLKLNYKFLPIPNLPSSVKITFTPSSGILKKKSNITVNVELLVSSTITLKTVAILDIGGIQYFFLIDFKSENSQFGIDYSKLELVDDYGYKVPRVLVMMKNHLYKNGGLYQESIFRLQCDQEELRQAKDQLNKGQLPNSIDTHIVANLIKQWFRDYPLGVLNAIPKPKFNDVEDESLCVTAFNTLPGTNKVLMLWLLDLLADVAAFEMDNKMSTKNLAIVFAPHLYPNIQDSASVDVLNHSRKVASFIYNVLSYRLRERYSQE